MMNGWQEAQLDEEDKEAIEVTLIACSSTLGDAFPTFSDLTADILQVLDVEDTSVLKETSCGNIVCFGMI